MSEKPMFVVDLDNPIAVYVQIENQVQFAIVSGKLKPGDHLPSVREMSTMLNVNPNTITKAYRDLELLQLVQTRRGVGVSVSKQAPKLCRVRTLPIVESHLRNAVAECVACGISAADIRKMVGDTISAGTLPYQEV